MIGMSMPTRPARDIFVRSEASEFERLFDQIMHRQDLLASDKMLLLTLAHLNRVCPTSMSIERLALGVGLSTRQLRTRMNGLKRRGLVMAAPQHRPQAPWTYRVTIGGASCTPPR